MNSIKVIVPVWINGKEETLKSSFDVTSPLNNKVCWSAVDASTQDAIQAVEAARLAFPSWSKVKPHTKQKILFKAADLLEERTADYGAFMMTEMGADLGTVLRWVLPTAIQFLRGIASQLPSILGIVPTPGAEGMSAMVWKEPYGVVLGISPW